MYMYIAIFDYYAVFSLYMYMYMHVHGYIHVHVHPYVCFNDVLYTLI